jgi:hypothetical protein
MTAVAAYGIAIFPPCDGGSNQPGEICSCDDGQQCTCDDAGFCAPAFECRGEAVGQVCACPAPLCACTDAGTCAPYGSSADAGTDAG